IKIDSAEEQRYGDSIVDAYLAGLRRQGLTVCDEGADADYLVALATRLRPFMKNRDRYETIKIYVVDSPRVDARSFPGGSLVFFRGLLDFADSEAAMVGIVG